MDPGTILNNILNNTVTAQWFLNLSFQSLLIVTSAWGLTRLTRRLSAPVCAGISLAAMMVLLLLPFGAQLFQWQEVTIYHTYQDPPVEQVSQPTARTETVKPDNPEYPVRTVAASPVTPLNSSAGDMNAVAAPVRSSWWERNNVRLANTLFLVWLAGSLFLLLRFFLGLYYVKGFRRSVLEVKDERVEEILAAAPALFGKTRVPRVFLSAAIDSPLTVGLFSPDIIIPYRLYRDIEREELKSLLFHELAHIYHKDQWVGILQRLVIIFNWWNPLAYSVSAGFSIAREYVSDNYAILGNGSTVYARSLFNLAKKTNLSWKLPATIGMATAHVSLEERIKQIISNDRKMQTRLNRPAVWMLAFASILLAILLTGYTWSFASGSPAAVKLPPETPKQEPRHQTGKETQPATFSGDIHQAVVKGNIEAVGALLDVQPGRLESLDKRGFSPLHIAIKTNRPEIVRFLVKRGAKLDRKSANGLTPLFIALDLSRGDMAALLIEKGADVNIKGYRGRTTLHMAARAADADIAAALLKMGLDADAGDADGITPLILVCENLKDNPRVAEMLIENGAGVDKKDKRGLTPLVHAVLSRNKKLARLLVDKGADVNARGIRISAEDNKKNRQKIAKRRSGKVFVNGRLLISKVIRDINEILLSEIITWGDTNLARLLIEKGADIHALDAKGKSPLFYAQKYRRFEIQKLLRAKGAK
jgi:ankyrin repeat protein/beta-lactamase regulating signal transducer with metallopeptidase domain